jgi:hypothetical protein
MKQADRDRSQALPKSLAVGIPPTGGWKETFLQYAGIPRLRLAGIEEGIHRGIRVFLWNQEDRFFDRADGNGERIAVITENGFLKRLFALAGSEKEGHSFRVADGGPFSERSFYIHAPCEILSGLASGHGACRDADGRAIGNSGIILEERKNILFLSVPWNLLNEQMGARWEFRPFYSPYIGKHFAETGPAIDFGALRRLFLELLLHAFRHVGLPLVRLRHPFVEKPAFSFRVDADGFSEESTESVLRISERTGNATFSWFVDVQGWGRNLGRVRDLVAHNQEVELHCYHHMTYRRESVNRVNLKRGFRKLERYGIRPRGVGSPYGFWFAGYQEAVRKFGCEYSSEFAFNVDDVPCFPYNRSDYPLQIPVHPGSVGVFEKVPFSRQEMFVHLRGTMEKAIRDCGCALLCDHPIGRIERYEKEFIGLFGDLISDGCGCVPLSAYAKKARAFLLEDVDPVAVGPNLRIQGTGAGGCGLEIILPKDAAFEVGSGRPFAVRRDLEQVRDTYEPPRRAEIERFLREHGKDQTLTNLTLLQWYRGLAKHRFFLLRREAREYVLRVMRQ